MAEIKQIRQETPAENPPCRMAAYCRVSSDSMDQRHSYAAQIQFYTDHIRQLPNTVLADIYCDEAVTGTKLDKRDDLKRLIGDARRGKLDRVIVKSITRFARNTYDCIEIARLLKKYGVSVYFEEQNLDTADMGDEFLLQMHAMQAQEESQTISRNMQWSTRGRMERGEFVGTAAYGYTVVGQTLEINEAEAEIVRRIFGMYLSGLGKQSIANTLNAEGIAHRDGKWHQTTVDYVLNNERVIGDALLQKSYTTGFPYRKVRNRGEMPQWYIENNHPAIIGRAMFEAAQRLQQCRQRDGFKRAVYPLSHSFVCPDCGHNYRRMVIRGIAYWQCRAQASRNKKCQSARLPEEEIYSAFLLLMNKLYLHRAQILPPMIAQLTQMQKRQSGTASKVYELDHRIAELNHQSHVIAGHREKGFLDAAEFATHSGALHQEVSKLRAARRALLMEDENDALINMLANLNEIIADLDGIQTEFNESLFAETVECITVVDESTLRFRLIGGLELEENTTYRKRR
jgi:DNA invertase Pin-like site-specific DNA recombinase